MNTILITAIIIGCLLLLRRVLQNILAMTGCITQVREDSMRPTLHEFDTVLTLPAKRKKLTRYRVITFANKVSNGDWFVKRIIGLPGETVLIKQGRVYIDGKLLDDDIETKIASPGKANRPITLGSDEYFVLGDNRNNSLDSRYFGPVKQDEIRQYMVCRLVPLSDKDRRF